MPRQVQMRSMKKPRTKKTITKKTQRKKPVIKTKGSKKKQIKKPRKVSKKKKNLKPRKVSKKQSSSEPLEYAKGRKFRRRRNRPVSVSFSPIEQNQTYIPNNQPVLNLGYNLYGETQDDGIYQLPNENYYYNRNYYEQPVPLYGENYKEYNPERNNENYYTPFNPQRTMSWMGELPEPGSNSDDSTFSRAPSFTDRAPPPLISKHTKPLSEYQLQRIRQSRIR